MIQSWLLEGQMIIFTIIFLSVSDSLQTISDPAPIHWLQINKTEVWPMYVGTCVKVSSIAVMSFSRMYLILLCQKSGASVARRV
jgi:hypothetical protein